MKQDKIIGIELRNLFIMVRRYIGKKHHETGCLNDDGHDIHCSDRHSGPTHLQILVMEYLNDNRDKDVYQKDLEKKFSIRRPTATNMLKRMSRDGLIERIPVPGDARLKKIVLTCKAEEHSKAMMDMGSRFEETLTEGLTDEEIDEFLKTINKIKANLEK